MTRRELVELRSVVALAEHHIRSMPPGRQRLEWTRLLRHGWQVIRRLTHAWIDGETGDQTRCP